MMHALVRRIGRYYAWYSLGFVALVLALALAERAGCRPAGLASFFCSPASPCMPPSGS